ncbi:MAG: ABC transporter substrate-binding protein, partial [Desulfobacterales bacterium]|nr:ABC transporter substrate-binding protein [Desulfobacterales bacterium]
VSFIVLFSGIILSKALAADPIKIGVLLPLTGRDAAIGQIQKNAVLMAATEINRGGGIKDRKIELVLADTEGSADGGRAAITKLIQQNKVVVVSGGVSSPAAWAASAIAQQNKIPFVVTSAAADKITEQGWDYVFRLNQPISEHLETLASFLSSKASDIKSVAIVHASSLRSSAAARRVFKRSAELGLEMVIRERIEAGAVSISQPLDRIKAKNPDLIYAINDMAKNAALLMRQSKSRQLNPKLFVGEGNGFVQSEFAAQAGTASNYLVSTVFWTPSVPHRGAGAFHKRFMDQHNIPPGATGLKLMPG